MFIEKKRKGVSPRLFTANGDSNGLVTVADGSDFFVKQIIYLASNTQQPQEFEIKRFITENTFKVGPRGDSIKRYSDISAFLTADLSVISAPEQDRPGITDKDYNRAVYAEEPIVAKRTILVDEFGNYYNQDNPLPINLELVAESVTVNADLEAITGDSPDNVLIVGSEDGTKTGIKRAARVDSDLDLRVGISDGANKAEVDSSRRLSVNDLEAQTILNDILEKLTNGEVPVSGPLTDEELRASPVEITGNVNVTLDDEPIKISGTEDGQPGGLEFTFVNNLRLQILAAKDREQAITYADFGTKDQRITQIDYTAPSIGAGPGFIARKTITYTLVSNKYRRDNIIWSLI